MPGAIMARVSNLGLIESACPEQCGSGVRPSVGGGPRLSAQAVLPSREEAYWLRVVCATGWQPSSDTVDPSDACVHTPVVSERPLDAPYATQHRLREAHLRTLIEALLDFAPHTRSELANRAGVARVTVQRLLPDLGQVLLRSPDGTNGGNGSAADVTKLQLDPKAGFILGIDIGRRHVRVALSDLKGECVFDDDRDPPSDLDEEPDWALDRAADLLRPLVKARDLAWEQLVGIAVGLPAPVGNSGELIGRPRRGMLAWRNLDLRTELRRRLNWPSDHNCAFFVDNDANLGALAEHATGAGSDASDLVYVKFSSGIGSAAIVDGKLVRGAGGVAGEWAHSPAPPDSAIAAGLQLDEATLCPRCKHQCVEVVANTMAIALQVEPKGRLRIDEVIARARSDRRSESQEVAATAIAAAAHLVGQALGPVVGTLNPKAVIIGGAFDEGSFDLIAPAIRAGLRHTAHPSALEDAVVQPGAHTGRAAAVGAIELVLRKARTDFLVRSGTS